MSTALLIPCFNATPYLSRLQAQVSALRPAFDEVILFDDGSSDQTSEIATRLGFSIHRSEQNLGPGGARNALARLTKAEWIHFHDVDDEIAPDYLDHFPAQLTNEADIVFHFVDFLDEVTRDHIIRWEFGAGLETDPARRLLTNPMGTTSSFMRRACFLAVAGFNEVQRCFEDGDLHFRIALSGARVRAVRRVLEWSLRSSRGAGANQHYCQSCRLEFLKSYAAIVPPRLVADVAAEAEKSMSALLRHKDAVQGEGRSRAGARSRMEGADHQ